MYLVSYRVDDIDMLSGRSGYLCEHLCCMMVVASDLRACGAFVRLTVCRLGLGGNGFNGYNGG